MENNLVIGFVLDSNLRIKSTTNTTLEVFTETIEKFLQLPREEKNKHSYYLGLGFIDQTVYLYVYNFESDVIGEMISFNMFSNCLVNVYKPNTIANIGILCKLLMQHKPDNFTFEDICGIVEPMITDGLGLNENDILKYGNVNDYAKQQFLENHDELSGGFIFMRLPVMYMVYSNKIDEYIQEWITESNN